MSAPSTRCRGKRQDCKNINVSPRGSDSLSVLRSQIGVRNIGNQGTPDERKASRDPSPIPCDGPLCLLSTQFYLSTFEVARSL